MLSVSMIALAATMVSCSKDDNGGNGGNGGNNKPEPETWAGTWEITSSHTMAFTDSGVAFEETEKTGTITIVDAEEIMGEDYAGLYVITGWSTEPTNADAIAMGVLSEDDNTSLWVMSGIQIENPDAEGYYRAWAGVGTDGMIISGQYPAYTFEFDGETAGIPYEGELQGGGTFTINAFDLFAFNDSEPTKVWITAEESYAGDITLTFVSDEVSASTASKAALSTLNPDFKMVYPAKVAKVAVAR